MPRPFVSSPSLSRSAYKGRNRLADETLESRGAITTGSSYVGVGFSLNPVARSTALRRPARRSTLPTTMRRSTGATAVRETPVPRSWRAATAEGYVLVKGSHVYKQQGTYDRRCLTSPAPTARRSPTRRRRRPPSRCPTLHLNPSPSRPPTRGRSRSAKRPLVSATAATRFLRMSGSASASTPSL